MLQHKGIPAYCYLLKVRTASTQSLQKLLSTIRNFPGITRTVTTIALETLKEEGTVRPLTSRKKRGEEQEACIPLL